MRAAASSATAAVYNLCILAISVASPGKVVFSSSPQLQRASLVTAALSWTALVFGTLGVLGARRRESLQRTDSQRIRHAPAAGLAASLSAIFVGLALAALNAFYVACGEKHTRGAIVVCILLGGLFVFFFVLAALDVLFSLLIRFQQIMPIVDATTSSQTGSQQLRKDAPVSSLYNSSPYNSSPSSVQPRPVPICDEDSLILSRAASSDLSSYVNTV